MILKEKIIPSITVLTLNRPDKRNALNIELMKQLYQALEEVHADPTQRVIILQGAGPAFCAGLDLAEAADLSKAEESAHLLAQLLSTLYLSPLVTIAAVHGAVLAGGMGLMAACDIAIASESSIFGLPEVHRGLVAAQIMTLLSRQLRQRDLKELLILGEIIDVKKAQSIGLINRIGTASDEAQAIAQQVLKGGPKAVAQTKRVLADHFSFSKDLEKAVALHHEIRQSDEAKEGIRAFLEKRKPSWDED